MSGPDDALVEMAAKAMRHSAETITRIYMRDQPHTGFLPEAAAALAVFREHDPLLAEAREALVEAQWALQPFSDRVSIVVDVGPVSANRFTDAHFAYRRVRAVVRKLEGKQ